jgi:hypothetical protein
LKPNAGALAELEIVPDMLGEDLLGREVFPVQPTAKIGSQLQFTPTIESAVAQGV